MKAIQLVTFEPMNYIYSMCILFMCISIAEILECTIRFPKQYVRETKLTSATAIINAKQMRRVVSIVVSSTLFLFLSPFSTGGWS